MAGQENIEVIMGLIVYSGNAKSKAMEAIQGAKEEDFYKADAKIKQAENCLVKAHKSQTSLLTKEAQGVNMTLTLLAVHSQDHLMTAITFIDLAKEIIEVYKKIE